ncbi:MAG: malate synthase G [Proteobacteria bacterium]|nr:malate synthase G [Pseudomonadota bacterium]MDA1135082.1 malate synthase G [Pseudomonadota bacterium]
MSNRLNRSNLQVSEVLVKFIENEALPNTGVNSDVFWSKLEAILDKFVPQNKLLLQKRTSFKNKIDNFYKTNKGKKIIPNDYINFLKEINYIVPEGIDFQINTQNVDPELSLNAGPQLVVPVMNARYALNAANARWGSMYDALYGTDVITEENGAEKGKSYNPIRGQHVVNYCREFLDKYFPLEKGSHKDTVSYVINDNSLQVTLSNDEKTKLKDDSKFVGYQGQLDNPLCILLKNNNLHVEIIIDKSGIIGGKDPAGINDIIMESALTTIQDCEDSIAAVDAEDKVLAYRNWLGLMKGDLQDTFEKNGKKITRQLNSDKVYQSKNGEYKLPGRSVMLIRNVGHLMTNPAILLKNGEEIPEGIMDAMITSLIAIHDIKFKKLNSRSGSVYIVKPKMHGPDEVKFACDIFSAVEDALNLDKHTLKIGIMDEERRTTVNLKECIRAAKDRTVFINTGFLDRTGDEIHTAMEAGPIIPKGEIKNAKWISAYENNNVKIGLECGLSGKAQIGKGMWAMPDLMNEMLKQKVGHPKSGANTAWVPSPTAATLHALHYHEIDVFKVQKEKVKDKSNYLDDILDVPVSYGHNWSPEEIQKEMDNNAQGILGYVVRWVDQGVGCSKVPDINNVGLMEDRATCRISSQHLANWLHHSIFSKDQLINTMKKMAKIVDQQNKSDLNYTPMSNDFENSIAFNASLDLIIEGTISPSGYTEPILHKRRIELKSKLG